jgi:hypothetical protein
MLNIPCPSRNEISDLIKIIEEKYSGEKKDTLKKITLKIQDRYSDFSQIELNNRIPSIVFQDEEKEALWSLYSSKTATSKAITDCIIRTQIAKQAGCCLNCGIGEVDQIDHFLPQEHFPEFSILHKNLIPSCGKCNEIKGDHIPGVNGKDYLHIMFDQLPNESFLTCTIDYTDDVAIANFMVLADFNSHRINTHFRSLNLEKRLRDKATQYFLQIRAYKAELGSAFAQEEVERDLIKIGNCFGTNFWKYILVTKMIETSFVTKIN